MAAITSVVIVDDRLYVPGGMVWRWVRTVTLEFSRHAKRAAPVRSGALRRGIHATTPRSTYKIVQGTIRSDAGHSTFVIRGTRPIIGTTHGKMAVGRNLYPPVTPMNFVRGQRANNFFLVAWARTAQSHPAIRGRGLPAALT